ncbi:MAG: thiamine ABC transporter substrate binding subunit [Actinomycetota bacterium]
MSSVKALGVVGVMVAVGTLASCSSAPPEPSGPSSSGPVTVRLLTHDSFALSDSVIADFETASGINLEIVTAGDAGEMVNRAVLSAGKPDADVLFGIDSTLLTRAVNAGVFDPYISADSAALRPELATLGEGVVTAIDDGDVCVNIDDGWFAERNVASPTSLDDLVKPEYRGLLVVQNPATSSPGLAFLLATISRYGDTWPAYWEALRANDVRVVNGWSEAYLGEFTAGGGEGDRPLVVSYSTSPPAEIVYAADPKPEKPSTSTMTDGCYRQVEFAGVLAGAAEPEAARTVVDWLLSPAVQADIPLSMFVFPARQGVALPDVFTDFVTRPTAPLEIPAADIDGGRDGWIEQWTEIVLR